MVWVSSGARVDGSIPSSFVCASCSLQLHRGTRPSSRTRLPTLGPQLRCHLQLSGSSHSSNGWLDRSTAPWTFPGPHPAPSAGRLNRNGLDLSQLLKQLCSRRAASAVWARGSELSLQRPLLLPRWPSCASLIHDPSCFCETSLNAESRTVATVSTCTSGGPGRRLPGLARPATIAGPLLPLELAG